MVRRYDALRQAMLDPNRERLSYVDARAIESMQATGVMLATTTDHFYWVWNVCIDAEKVGRLLRARR